MNLFIPKGLTISNNSFVDGMYSQFTLDLQSPINNTAYLNEYE